MKVLIGIPCSEMLHSRFAQCLLSLGKPEGTQSCFAIGSLIQRNREAIANIAIESEADCVLWLDSDMIFRQDVLEKLLALNVDIAGGLYFKKEPPFAPEAYERVSSIGNIPVSEIPETPFAVEGIGFGCVLTRTDVLRKIKEKEGIIFAPIGNMGEDMSFCLRARKYGYEILCDPRIQCGHIGSTVVTEDYYREFHTIQ